MLVQGQLGKKFQWIKPSDRGASDAFCILCKSHISISSSAKHDLIIKFYLVCLPYSIFKISRSGWHWGDIPSTRSIRWQHTLVNFQPTHLNLTLIFS